MWSESLWSLKCLVAPLQGIVAPCIDARPHKALNAECTFADGIQFGNGFALLLQALLNLCIKLICFDRVVTGLSRFKLSNVLFKISVESNSALAISSGANSSICSETVSVVASKSSSAIPLLSYSQTIATHCWIGMVAAETASKLQMKRRNREAILEKSMLVL